MIIRHSDPNSSGKPADAYSSSPPDVQVFLQSIADARLEMSIRTAADLEALIADHFGKDGIALDVATT